MTDEIIHGYGPCKNCGTTNIKCVAHLNMNGKRCCDRCNHPVREDDGMPVTREQSDMPCRGRTRHLESTVRLLDPQSTSSRVVAVAQEMGSEDALPSRLPA